MGRSIKSVFAGQSLKINAMPLRFALLTSLFLHFALILAPAWPAAYPPTARPANLQARLLPSTPVASQPADAVSTEAQQPEDAVAPDAITAQPKKLRGAALKQAQSTLSEHLFYPPEAVAAGLEGEVVLLLTLGEGGRIVTAEIAGSSGHRVLDEAALAAASRIGALPGNLHQMLLPVTFRLQ